MHSLKTARPLLASVAYFVIFAMVLFSCVFSFPIFLKFFNSLLFPHQKTPHRCRVIGVQAFKGSLRRTCFISPTLGETSPIQNPNQFCGGFIDPVTLETMGYLQLDGKTTVRESKGYICPLGQICTVCGFSLFLRIWTRYLRGMTNHNQFFWAGIGQSAE